MERKLVGFSSEIMRLHRLPGEVRFGLLYKPLVKLRSMYKRITGEFGQEDQLRIACDCEPPMYFMLRGCMIPHPYGITLSVEEIGADCEIGQNVTIGTDGRNMKLGGAVMGKPVLGNLVRIHSGAVISGEIRIGNNVVIGANAFVNRDVPDNSFVIERNNVQPLEAHHKYYLALQLYHCMHIYRLVPGLIFKSGQLYVDEDYAEKRSPLLELLLTESKKASLDSVLLQ
jgi:hypothetical protein